MKRKKWYLVISTLFILFGSYLFVKSNIENIVIMHFLAIARGTENFTLKEMGC